MEGLRQGFSCEIKSAQPELLEYLSSRLYDMGFSLDIESCGYFEFERVRSALERMDLPDAAFGTPTKEKMEHLKGILREIGISLADFK